MAKLDIVVDVVTKGKGNLSGLANDIGAAEGKSEKLKTGLGGIKTAVGALAGVFAATQAVEFFADAIQKAGEFEDTVAASGVIMGKEAVPALEEWASTAATAFGASEQLALESANQMAVFGKSAGLAGDDLKSFATDMTQLGGDLASFFGGSTEEAITAIGAALRGESEPIRKYGVLLDDATLRQKAFELGLVTTTKQGLTPQVRVLAAQAEIMEQTSDAQGDFARTSDGLTNTQRTLGAEFENIQKQIGEELLPLMTDVARFIKDNLIPAFSALGNVADFITHLVNPFQAVVDQEVEANKEHKKQQAAQLKVTEDHWQEMQGIYSAAAESIAGEAEKIATVPITEIEDKWDDVRSAAFETTVQYQLGLLDAQDKVKTAMEVLTRLQSEEMDEAARIAYLKGILTGDQLQSGLKSDLPGTRAAANAIRGEVVAELASLGVDAYGWGSNITTSLAAGMRKQAALDTVGISAYAVGNIIRAGVGIESEPSDPNSPLRGITKWGANMVDTIAQGMLGNLSVAQAATQSLAGALVLAPMQGAAMSPGAAMGMGQQININLTVDGDLPSDREGPLVDMIGRMMRTAGMGELDSVLPQ